MIKWFVVACWSQFTGTINTSVSLQDMAVGSVTIATLVTTLCDSSQLEKIQSGLVG